MKSRFFGFVFLLFCIPTTVLSQLSKELDPGYYIVVSAYGKSKEHFAKIYQDKLQSEGIKADYGFDSKRDYFYVYVDYFKEFEASLRKMRAVRTEGRFKDAWVRVIPGDISTTKKEPDITKEEKPGDVVVAPDVTYETEPKIVEEEETDKTAILIYPPPVEEQKEEIAEPVIVEETKVVNLSNTEVYLSLFNTVNNRVVEGQVMVIDTERSKLLGEFNGNEALHLPDPNTNSGKLTLISDAFGYRKMQHDINFQTPFADTSQNHIKYVDGVFVVNFNLIKYRKGDVAILYNVYFYNDAALMLPESKFELNNLARMMSDNPEYRIKLHGHTNGKSPGRILEVGPGKEFFEITADAVETNGTAKNLSRKRAETIRDYLTTNGIDGDRIEIKAWGGKKPLANKLGPDAHQNVRVEVEILGD